jgi:hypothetical protein
MRLALRKRMEIAVDRTAPMFVPNADCKPKQAEIENARFVWLVAILLSILHGALAVTAAMQKSPTFDEPTHLTAGYSYWVKNDFRLDPENGNLPARWAAVPLLFSQPKFPPNENASWKQGDVGRVSQQFLYGIGNDSDRLLLQSRTMMVAFSVALCLLIFFCSKQLFGTIGGLISESIAVFDPNLLGHGALVTSDVAVAFFFTAAIWSYWWLLRRVTIPRFVLCALSVAGLFLAKMSGPLFLFMAAILSAICIFSREPVGVRIAGVERIVAQRWRKAAVTLAFTSAIGAVVVLAIWTSFSFRFSAFTETGPARELWNSRWNGALADHTLAENMVAFARAHRLLPEAYLHGLAYIHKSAMFRPAFLDGHWSNVGFPSFFPRAFCYKTPLPVLFLLATVVLVACLRWCRASVPASRWKIILRDLTELSPVWTLVLVYSAFALTTNLNIGHRYLLPIYPALFIACGASSYFFRQTRTRLIAACALAMVAWQLVESFGVRPNYIAYFNELAGGPAAGYKHLVDSSLDWGQDLPDLKNWLAEHKGETPEGQVYLAYFGTADPRWYEIEAIPLAKSFRGRAPSPLKPGTYCISATNLQQVYTVNQGNWNQSDEAAYQTALRQLQGYDQLDPKSRNEISTIFERRRFGRLCAYLRHREPTANVGYSILIFRLTEDDLREALRGPPAELMADIPVRN